MSKFAFENFFTNSTITDDSNPGITPGYIIVSILLLGCALCGSYAAYKRSYNNAQVEPEPEPQAAPDVAMLAEEEVVFLGGVAPLEVQSFGE